VRYNYEYDLESLSEFDVRVTVDANRANAVNTQTAKPSPRHGKLTEQNSGPTLW